MSLDKSGSLSLLDRLSKPSSLPTKPIFALPPKPSVPPPPPVSRYRDSSSPPPRARTDVYIASPSPPPIRSERDVYIPSPPRRDVYISSPKRRRSPSLYRRSPSPRRHRSPSPRKSRIRSVSVKRRSPSPRRSLSVSPAPADLPKTFYTHSHIREEDLKKKQEAYKEQQRIRALRRETDRQRAAEQRDAENRKREASPSNHQPQAKRIPTGPSAGPSVPTGPRLASRITPAGPSTPTGPRGLSKPLPTGPKAPTGPRSLITSAAYSTQPAFAEPPSADIFPSPRRSSSRSRSPSMTRSVRGSGRSPGVVTFSEPVYDEQYILEQYGQGRTLNSPWAEKPKEPLGNYLGRSVDKAMNSEEGRVKGRKVWRSTIRLDDGRIIGLGDALVRKDSERLAGISAVLQLIDAGLLELKGDGKVLSTKVANSPAPSDETAKLSDGTHITYDRARQFMEYYCQRYKFGKPDIETSQTKKKSSKKGKGANTVWDAVMTVGGKRIGMGQAQTKKKAQIQCYLDVTQYLESCDKSLWSDFLEHSKKDNSADIGMAPHLVFQLSDNLNEDIYSLCSDIKQSTLYKTAPPVGVQVEHQPMPGWQGNRNGNTSEEFLTNKSNMLQEKLAAYQSDPQLEKMRAQRHSLPVSTKATDILAKIEVNDVTIIMAATGSGKTTQIPQLLFDDYINRGEGAKCNIICTQPRRLAAMSVAERIADERGDRLGGEVGYQVRFDVKLPQPNGSITFCTTGIFLKRMQSSLGTNATPSAVAAMDQVTHIVVDEVHERDIDTDLSLVVLKQLLIDRKKRGVPLKIVLMSATIDPTLFTKYFIDDRGRPAPVAEVPGRTFPVERRHLDDIVPALQKGLSSRDGGWVFNEKNVNEYLAHELSPNSANFGPNTGMALEIPYPLVALTIAHVMRESDDGHVLVFLPGWDEIKKVSDLLLNPARSLLGQRFSDSSKYSIHYLHSNIPAAEQREVFKPPPPGVRRIILATNIAETSVTIPDVVYVVDTGRVKEKRYDPERHMSSLVSAWVGSSNLNQRAGRAGRHRPGQYYGLISERRKASLDPHQLVEMKRSDLSNVVMHVKALNLGEVEEVLAATIEPPEPSRIVLAMTSLHMLGAMDASKNLTSLGRVLLQLPVDAAIGKLCLYGSFFRCLDSALTLAAVLTNRDPFLAPIAMKQQANEVKDSWSPTAFRSDPLAIVAAYNSWLPFEERNDYRGASAFCQDNFLSKSTLLQIKQVKGSLLQSLEQAGVIAVSAGGTVGRIGRREIPAQLNENGQSLPMLAALIAMASAPNFALRTSEKALRTAQDKMVFIHAGSVNAKKRESGGPELPSASFNPAEKRLYSFGEKTRNVPLGGNPNNAQTNLRTVTRLDPMTYMLFGAYNLVVTQRGLECDNWLPVVGNLHALDDVQRLKTLLDACMLRVFEGVGKSLTKGRDDRWRHVRNSVVVGQQTSSRIVVEDADGDEGENESDDEDIVEVKKRIAEPLSQDEIKELELLTTDVVRILDSYAAEREGGESVVGSRVGSPGPFSAGNAGGHGGGGGRGGGYGGSGGYGAAGGGHGRGERW